jgi:hypothetical protein
MNEKFQNPKHPELKVIFLSSNVYRSDFQTKIKAQEVHQNG